MTRVLSGAVLLGLAIAVVWLSPAAVFFVVAELLLVLGFVEYAALARSSGLPVPAVPACAAAMLTCAAFTRGLSAPIDVVLMTAFVALGALTLTAWNGGRDALGLAAASLFPSLYLGLPLGAMVAIRETRGREGLFLLMLTVFVSDTAQYYSGRAFGRRPLAPKVSPKKTVEGADRRAGVWRRRACRGGRLVAAGGAGGPARHARRDDRGARDRGRPL